MSEATYMIREMIRGDLEQAFEHLCNDQEDFAERKLDAAKEKIGQIRELKNQQALTEPQNAEHKQLTIDIP